MQKIAKKTLNHLLRSGYVVKWPFEIKPLWFLALFSLENYLAQCVPGYGCSKA